MSDKLLEVKRFRTLDQYLNIDSIIKFSFFDSETEPLIDYNFQDGKVANADGSFQALANNCIYHDSLDGKNHVIELGSPGSHIRLPIKDFSLPLSSISLSLDFKFQDNKQDRINLFEGSALPLVLMLIRDKDKYYPTASINLSNSWQITRAEEALVPNQWHHISLVFTGEEVYIFKDRKVIARRIFKNAKLSPVGQGDFFIGSWVDGKRDQLKGMISSFKLWDGIAGHLSSPMKKASQTGMGEIYSKYMDLGGERSLLGKQVGNEEEINLLVGNKSSLLGRSCNYSNGAIYWSSGTGAYEVHGDILARYKALGGPRSSLGFPRTDEMNGRISGSRLNSFENGAIYWSGKTGAQEMTGRIFAKYILLGGERSFLGLPTQGEFRYGSGSTVIFQGGRIFDSPNSGSHEIHGAILGKYLSLSDSIRNDLGFPISDEEDILNSEGRPTGKKVSNFERGGIYWSSATGALEVHGDIYKRYQALGGAGGSLGVPTSDESSVVNTPIRYNNFQNGIIVWKPAWGAREFTNLDLRLGKVISGEIDDGVTWTGKDRSAELITYTTVKVNNTVLDNGTRRPKDYAGTSYDINKNYSINNIKHDTKIYFSVQVDDWDAASSNDYLGTIEKTFDITSLWGMDNASNGIYDEHPLTRKGADAPRLDSVKLSFAITIPSRIDRNKHFREQFWWKFDNFKGLNPLPRDFYANTFKDVEIIRNNLWEKMMNPFDTAIYELAYKDITKAGNCFGMSLEALYAIKNRSLFTIPLDKYEALGNKVKIDYHTELPSHIYKPINRKHGYQIGSSAVSWTLGKLLSADAMSPVAVFNNVKRLLNQGDYPVISMMSISKGSGHAVLAYKYNQGTNYSRIYVADPNIPYSVLSNSGDAGYIEIDHGNNSFKFYTGQKDGRGNLIVSYQTGRTAAGLLDDTYMIEFPYHVLSSQPSTPFLEVLMGLIFILGGILFLLGDAESEQISSGANSFYDYSMGEKRQKKNGIKDMARVPLFDLEAGLLELYAFRGQPPQSLEFSLKGVRNGNYTQELSSYNSLVKIEAPILQNERDTINLDGANTSRPNISLKTSGRPKQVKLSYELLNDRKRTDRVNYNISLQASNKDSLIGIDQLAGSLIISQAGPAREILVEKEFMENNQLQKQVLKINPSREDEVIKLSSPHMDRLGKQVLIESLDPKTGKIINKLGDIFK